MIVFQTMDQVVKASRGRHEFRLFAVTLLPAMNENEEEEISEDDTSLDADHHIFLKQPLMFAK